MRMHTIPQPLYTNFLVDGQEYPSDNNLIIRISIKGNDIYFNDAKVTNSNIMWVNLFQDRLKLGYINGVAVLIMVLYIYLIGFVVILLIEILIL